MKHELYNNQVTYKLDTYRSFALMLELEKVIQSFKTDDQIAIELQKESLRILDSIFQKYLPCIFSNRDKTIIKVISNMIEKKRFYLKDNSQTLSFAIQTIAEFLELGGAREFKPILENLPFTDCLDLLYQPSEPNKKRDSKKLKSVMIWI